MHRLQLTLADRLRERPVVLPLRADTHDGADLQRVERGPRRAHRVRRRAVAADIAVDEVQCVDASKSLDRAGQPGPVETLLHGDDVIRLSVRRLWRTRARSRDSRTAGTIGRAR